MTYFKNLPPIIFEIQFLQAVSFRATFRFRVDLSGFQFQTPSKYWRSFIFTPKLLHPRIVQIFGVYQYLILKKIIVRYFMLLASLFCGSFPQSYHSSMSKGKYIFTVWRIFNEVGLQKKHHQDRPKLKKYFVMHFWCWWILLGLVCLKSFIFERFASIEFRVNSFLS